MIVAHEVPIGFGEAFVVAAGLVTWVAVSLTYHRGSRSSIDRSEWRLVTFVVGTALIFAVLSPPLEHLAEDLVSVHMVQHVTLILIGAPLIALSRPLETLLRGLPRRVRKYMGRWRRTVGLTPSTTRRVIRPLIVWLFYGLAIWFWHGSGPYELAAGNTWIHLLEHTVFLGAALVFWSIVLVPWQSRVGDGFRILMVFTTAFHSVLLGALLTFSDTVWYQSYTESTIGLGVDPLADLRLAGLLMWIPGSLVYTSAALWLLITLLRGEDRSQAGRWRTGDPVGSGLASSASVDRI